ncbi:MULTISPECIES: bifunctional tRNA pseudouridine(32) synthase/23S rRNA pseudouridine(746) synthase RluA [Salinivibrio]|uniref:RNA pseudouridine synthase n=1 Tax=Salinivibrio costicola subsp. alcaliphilus TaxID=272773 RepID=A0ABX3KSW7_SALCS|nr:MULTISPECIES: bifunctional tRNA pseudouridine(32) synthase/23S rRNA pseudouridine(746) synthase RluA [Salinivibrio]OOE94042.1 RNA pseudouridine synthase [Salinivibrio sp. AR640]OOE94449.1 RNA pseudouridine synthase [Salinivibrio sp. AR647]OOE99863.1 RNA pseudouridine synthase [Salinivibrio sp. IB643]OOF07740.1 RNA pseudouridine synthase [Salinivibrio sp. MA440]OOF34623.1 RNA pseudouridine synthase [Salinivibrio costicola subsp. alcaliphilus]
MAIIEYHPPTTPWLDILYQDADLVVINKPSGLLANPGRDPAHYDSAWSRVKAEFPDAELVHRLDMSTSGVMAFAAHKAAERHLKAQFRERVPTKLYYAEVWGHPIHDEGNVDLPLICDWPNRPRQKVCFEHGKPSQTHYRCLHQHAQTSLMALYPLTGRSHQLRVHMQALGHGIVGDEFYALPEAFEYASRLHLHAAELSILHPVTETPMHFQAPCAFYPQMPDNRLASEYQLAPANLTG